MSTSQECRPDAAPPAAPATGSAPRPKIKRATRPARPTPQHKPAFRFGPGPLPSSKRPCSAGRLLGFAFQIPPDLNLQLNGQAVHGCTFPGSFIKFRGLLGLKVKCVAKNGNLLRIPWGCIPHVLYWLLENIYSTHFTAQKCII